MLSSGQSAPTAIALRGSAVYWSVGDPDTPGAVLALDDAGQPTRVVAPERPSPTNLVLTDTHAVWLEASPPRLVRAPLMGGDVELLVDVDMGPSGTATDAEGIYFGLAGALAVWPRSGQLPISIAGDAYPLAIAVDEASVFWVQCRTGALERAAKSGGPSEPLAEAGCPFALVRDGESLYWIDYAYEVLPDMPAILKRTTASTGETVELWRVPLSDPNPVVLHVLAVDEESIWFARADGLYRVPKQGGGEEQVAVGHIAGVAVDGACVAWLDADKGGVVAMRKDR